ncbi:MAG: hypothetical protein U0X93_01870 [Anaerolineales bacterium]
MKSRWSNVCRRGVVLWVGVDEDVTVAVGRGVRVNVGEGVMLGV